MKNSALLLLLVLICFSCSNGDKYVVEGTVTNSELDGKLIYMSKLNYFTDSGMEQVDSITIQSGKFKFKGEQKEPAVYIIYVKPENDPAGVFASYILIQPGKATVNITDKLSVGGNESNDVFQKNMDALFEISEKLNNIQQSFISLPEEEKTDDALEKAQDEFSRYMEQIKINNYEYLKNNINDLLAQVLYPQTSELFSKEEQENIINNANEITRNKEPFKSIIEEINMVKSTDIGQRFTDLEMNDIDGKPVALSDYAGKGKYVLVDFWASWCGPCIREMPTLLEIYKDYQNKDFEIVGISLDTDIKAWKNSVIKQKITWPQMSELAGWESKAVKKYQVDGIPHTVLLDKEGNILEKGLRGKELIAKLKEILN